MGHFRPLRRRRLKEASPGLGGMFGCLDDEDEDEGGEERWSCWVGWLEGLKMLAAKASSSAREVIIQVWLGHTYY